MNNESVNTKKLALTAIFAAVAVVGSMFSFPVFGSKCAPVQHLVNVLCAVFLGPGWGLAAAFNPSGISGKHVRRTAFRTSLQEV